MNHGRCPRTVIWIFASSVEFGYLQSIQFGFSRWQFVWLVACVLLSIGVALLHLIRRDAMVRHRRSKRFLFIGLCISIHVVGWLYGAFWEMWNPARVPDLEGVETVAVATVASVQQGSTGTIISLHVDHLVPVVTINPSRNDTGRRCDVDASLRVSNKSQLSNILSAGDRVELRGLLVYPGWMVRDASPTFLAKLFSARPRYEFLGRIVTRNSAEPGVWRRFLADLNTSIASVGQGTDQQRRLLLSLVFGGQSVDADMKLSFQDAGVLHVLAASGANVMLVVMTIERLFGWLPRLLRIPYRLWAALLIFATWCFAGLCGFVPSIDRAAWMTTHRYASRIVLRRSTSGSSLAFAALAMAIVQPGTLASIGAVLSFAATAAVGTVLDKHEGSVRKTGRPLYKLYTAILDNLSQTFRVTLAVELYVVPLTITFFQQLTPYALVSNLLVEPLLLGLLPITVIGFACTLLATWLTMFHTVARLVVQLCFDLQSVLLWWVNTVGHFPGALIAMRAPTTLCLGLYYTVLIFGPGALRKWYRQRHARRKWSNADAHKILTMV